MIPADSRRRLEERRAAIDRAVEKIATDALARELWETQSALQRMERGTYGRCECCLGAVGRQRLIALPAARYCMSCSARDVRHGRCTSCP